MLCGPPQECNQSLPMRLLAQGFILLRTICHADGFFIERPYSIREGLNRFTPPLLWRPTVGSDSTFAWEPLLEERFKFLISFKRRSWSSDWTKFKVGPPKRNLPKRSSLYVKWISSLTFSKFEKKSGLLRSNNGSVPTSSYFCPVLRIDSAGHP